MSRNCGVQQARPRRRSAGGRGASPQRRATLARRAARAPPSCSSPRASRGTGSARRRGCRSRRRAPGCTRAGRRTRAGRSTVSPVAARYRRQPPVEGGVDRQQRDVAGGVDLVDHHHPPLAHRLHERRVDELHLPAGAGDRDVVVAEEELVRRRAGLELDEPVERRAVPVGHVSPAVGPQAVGDRAGDLALARAGRADQPQEARLRPGRPCRAAPGRARRSAGRAGTAGRSVCRRAAGSARRPSRARAARRGRGRGPPRRRPRRSATGQR